MARPQGFLAAIWAERSQRSYTKLGPERQLACDRALIKQDPTPGLRVKPILPDKDYLEARISSGDRIIFRLEATTILFVDVVTHDDIERYSRGPRGR